MRRLRVLTWHVHGKYLYYLSQVPHEFCIVTDAQRSPRHAGRNGTLPWGTNVHEVTPESVATLAFDVVLYQSRAAWDEERLRLLSPAQQRLPRMASGGPSCEPEDGAKRSVLSFTWKPSSLEALVA